MLTHLGYLREYTMVLANDELYQYASKEKRVHEKLYILNGVFTSTGQKEEIMHCNKI
jgi:hypothetical protein